MKHGKDKYIDFKDKQLKKLRNYFNSLDEDGSGSIGVDELEDPLIALGLVETRQQVKEIIEIVDQDASEMIEFEEFLDIIKAGSAASKEKAEKVANEIDVVKKAMEKASRVNEDDA